jgi:hypothetical protein
MEWIGVDQHSDEWNKVEYSFRFCFGDVSVQSVQHLYSANFTNNFSQSLASTASPLKLTCWKLLDQDFLIATTHHGPGAEDEIDGLQEVPLSESAVKHWVDFQYGRVRLPRTAVKTNRVLTAVMCEVFVGQSYLLDCNRDNASEASGAHQHHNTSDSDDHHIMGNIELPQNVLLMQVPDDYQSIHAISKSKAHFYRVRSSNQVLPMYEIKFVLNSSEDIPAFVSNFPF